MDTSLNLLPIAGAWRDVLARVFEYMREHHEPPPAMPRDAFLLVADLARKQVVDVRRCDLASPVGAAPAGLCYWRSLSVELRSRGGHSTLAAIRVHAASAGITFLELGLSGQWHEAVFDFDASERSINPDGKSDLMGFCIGLTRASGAAGFEYQLCSGDNLFGPPDLERLRARIEGEFEWRPEQNEALFLAGLAAAQVEEGRFVYDLEYPAVHYRQDGFYLYDMLWPTGAFG